MSEPTTQCPTCGRCAEDWASPDSRKQSTAGGKTKQTEHGEDESGVYRKWRLGFGRPYYATDVDQVEWRPLNGTMTPIAVLELTRVPGNRPVPSSYLKAILTRYMRRDSQAATAIGVGHRLDCPAFIVAHRWDLTEFWVYNLSRQAGWAHGDRQTYTKFIRDGLLRHYRKQTETPDA
jgi:hypothetical protein